MHVLKTTALIVFHIQISTIAAAENCSCEYHEKYDWIGPFCGKWSSFYPPHCLLAGKEDSKFCSGAIQGGYGDLYWTADKEVCNRSIRPNSVRSSSSIIPPLSMKEMLDISLHSLVMIIGTIGNALVVKYFAFGDISIWPGSRFVVVLAVIDFVSSV